MYGERSGVDAGKGAEDLRLRDRQRRELEGKRQDELPNRHIGHQGVAFFNAHHNNYMYFTLLVFDADGRLAGLRLRPGNAGGSRYATPLMDRLVHKLKARFPNVRVLVRADGGFCTPRFLDAMERSDRELGDVRYVVGLPQNSHLLELSHALMEEAADEARATKQTTRRFGTFWYATRNWSHKRRVVVKAEHLADKSNPRFVVTSADAAIGSRAIYETIYCPRGQAENAIKDFKRALAGDRLSCTTYVANAFRLFLHAVAYRLLDGLRRVVVRVAPAFGPRQLGTLSAEAAPVERVDHAPGRGLRNGARKRLARGGAATFFF